MIRPLRISSVQFSCSVMSNSLRPHESQHARPPCPLLTPRVHPNPCLLCRWCHPAISSSVVPLPSCPQSLPESGFFPVSHLFSWGGQSIGVSASTSVLPMNTQDWPPLGWTEDRGLLNITGLNKYLLIFFLDCSVSVNVWLISWLKRENKVMYSYYSSVTNSL